jgi:enterochelin esterase-like enzyme
MGRKNKYLKFFPRKRLFPIFRDQKEKTELTWAFETPTRVREFKDASYFSYGTLVFAKPIEAEEEITETFEKEEFKEYAYRPVALASYSFCPDHQAQIDNFERIDGFCQSPVIEFQTYPIMKKMYVLLLLFSAGLSMAQIPIPASGTVKRFENFASKYVEKRNIDVWLPEGYDPQKKYAVLYMHDGQMLFDSTKSWNKQEWGVDETLSQLMRENKIKNCLVVGVWNADRHPEYFPQKPFESLSKIEQDSVFKAKRPSGKEVFYNKTIKSDKYLKFLVKEVKPFIDKTFSTLPDAAHTFVAGSSMGGLISMYAICEYPKVFGGAACLSTHWLGIFETKNNPIPAAFMAYLQKKLPNPKNHRLYFDYGTVTLDALYPPYQKQADAIIKSKGYTEANWISREFTGEDHSERAWRKRLAVPLSFLLAK